MSFSSQVRRRWNTWSGQRFSRYCTAGQSAQGSAPLKLAGSRSPCAPTAGGAARASSLVSPTLIIQTCTSFVAPLVSTGFIVSETKISLRPTATCARTA